MAYLEAAQRRSAEELGTPALKKGLRLAGRRLEWWLPAVVLVVALSGWEWLSRTGGVSPLFFPAPSVIARTLWQMLRGGELAVNVGATMSRVLLGLGLGGVPGLLLGLSMGWWPRLRVVMEPFIAAAHPIPKLAVLPLIMIIFGLGEASKVVVAAVAAFFPMLINGMAGVRQISPIHFEVAESYGASRVKVLTRVVVPGSLPLVLAGARLALNSVLVLTIGVELVAARKGLGAMIWLAWETLRTEELYAAVAVTAVLGISFNLLLQRLTARLVPWQVERES